MGRERKRWIEDSLVVCLDTGVPPSPKNMHSARQVGREGSFALVMDGREASAVDKKPLWPGRAWPGLTCYGARENKAGGYVQLHVRVTKSLKAGFCSFLPFVVLGSAEAQKMGSV